MKFFPLIWAALIRKPAGMVLTLLSITAAFTLFGLTIGIGATFAGIEGSAREDRMFVDPRFGEPLPTGLESQIAALPGVAHVGAISMLEGYHQKETNDIYVMMADANMRVVRGDWPLTSAQWDALNKNRTGLLVSKTEAARLHLKAGDDLVIVAPSIIKADGSKSWTFKVLDIVGDVSAWVDGYMIGNADYLDQSKPLSDQGKTTWFEVLATTPELTPIVASGIVQAFTNSATPLQTETEKAQYSAGVSGVDMISVTRSVALAGLCMILFLTANVIAQSVRERFTEFATLKTIGYSDFAILILVAVESAIPCAAGAILGVSIAAGLANVIPRFYPPSFGLPVPSMTPSVFALAAASAIVIALASTALPALRLRKMDIATVLSGR